MCIILSVFSVDGVRGEVSIERDSVRTHIHTKHHTTNFTQTRVLIVDVADVVVVAVVTLTNDVQEYLFEPTTTTTSNPHCGQAGQGAPLWTPRAISPAHHHTPLARVMDVGPG